MAKQINVRARKAWAICERSGIIHLDKIMSSKSEAWGLLTDEMPGEDWSISGLKKNGYRCVRVEIRPVQ